LQKNRIYWSRSSLNQSLKLSLNLKFEKLKQAVLVKKFKATNETTSKCCWIKNISLKDLTIDEQSVFTIRNKPVGEIEIARTRIAQVLHNSRPPTPNVSLQEINALNNLKSDNSIIILKVYKGNTTVVMDKDDYDSKISQLINDNNTYRKIMMKPNTAIENDVNKFLWRLAKEKKLLVPFIPL